MPIPHALVVVGSTVRRGDDSLVVRKLKQDAENTAVLMDSADDYSPIQGRGRRMTAVLDQIGNIDLGSAVKVIPFIAQRQSGRQELAVISIVLSNRVAHVTIHHLATFSTPWDDAMVSITDETIISVIKRSASTCRLQDNWSNLASEIEQDLSRLNSIFLSNILEDITNTARSVFRAYSSDVPVRRGAFERILDTRSRLHNAIVHLESNGLSESPMGHGLRNAAAGCDTSTASLAGMVAVVMQEQASMHADQELERERNLIARDRFLARIAATLLLPGLWFGFMGTNVIPSNLWGWETQSELSVALVFGIGCGLAIIGWFATPRKATS